MLTRYEQNGLELLINEATGETFASISALARMTDKSRQSISKYVNGGLEGVTQMVLKSAQIDTGKGISTVNLLNENQILEVIAKYKPDLLVKCAKAGLRLFLHGLAGYKYQVTPPAPIRPHRDTKDWVECAEKIKQFDDPILVSGLMQSLYEDLKVAQKALPVSENRHVPIAVLAREMGYHLGKGEDSKLGKFTKKHLVPSGQAPHGRYMVFTYIDNETTRSVINLYFKDK